MNLEQQLIRELEINNWSYKPSYSGCLDNLAKAKFPSHINIDRGIDNPHKIIGRQS